jgi:uncharacterized damage-inducible protein DinB
MSCSPQHFRVMAAYNAWINRQIYSVCDRIPDAKRREDLGAFFKSIHGTLNHILIADRIWLGRFIEEPFYAPLDSELYADFKILQIEREKTDLEITVWVNTLTAEKLSQPFTYTSRIDGKRRSLPYWLLLNHTFNHQTHHRGQLTTLMSQLNYDYGVTDLPWLPGLNDLL